METESKTERTSPTLDDLFRRLGETDFLYIKTNAYLQQLREDREYIIKQIEQITDGINSKDLGNEE